MNDYLHDNKAMWDEWARLHAGSEFYDVEGFKRSRNSLKPIEIAEMGDVAGQTLLHLQCHFGQDTLSWAARGADVTGADFSDEAIGLARALAGEMALPARFVCSDLYSLPAVLDGQFDRVFTSYGTIVWLPDITRWAQGVAHFLKPGGVFYMVEFHPMFSVYEVDAEGQFRIMYRYFYTPEAEIFHNEGSYAGVTTSVVHRGHEWAHSLGDVVTALIDAGLTLEFLHEFPYSTYNVRPNMIRISDDEWRLPEGLDGHLPLLFSLRAHK